PRLLAELEPTSSVFLYIHHHIREDAQTLYGFATVDDRATFRVLLTTHGVGPALALAILATHPPAVLVDVVAEGDAGALTLVPGVGKKTAERLIVELRNRLSLPIIEGGAPLTGGERGSPSAITEVREALAGLGYQPDEIRESLRELAVDGEPASLLREALQQLAVRRA
ncbi:MAG: Holliday junction branch migration protein RuvA, partial [Actinomycetota bacterium]|nr:Holliday junction branch migration protein RuvA [Actinomycetota bacterium]